MSLQTLALAEQADYDEMPITVVVWDWVRSHIDFPKFRRRAVQAQRNPGTVVKVVLMEYQASYRAGDVAVQHFIPNTRYNTLCLQYDREVKHYLHYHISDNDPNTVVYSRRKIVDGTPDPCLRQLVVMFNAIQPPLPRAEELDEEVLPPTQG